MNVPIILPNGKQYGVDAEVANHIHCLRQQVAMLTKAAALATPTPVPAVPAAPAVAKAAPPVARAGKVATPFGTKPTR